MADYYINQGISAEGQEIQSWSKAKQLSNNQIVEALTNYEELELVLEEDFAVKVLSICQWFKDKGFLTTKQRDCLNAAFVEIEPDLPEIEDLPAPDYSSLSVFKL